jgi:hypothetical protein
MFLSTSTLVISLSLKQVSLDGTLFNTACLVKGFRLFFAPVKATYGERSFGLSEITGTVARPCCVESPLHIVLQFNSHTKIELGIAVLIRELSDLSFLARSTSI